MNYQDIAREELGVLKGIIAEIRYKNKIIIQNLAAGKINSDEAANLQDTLISEFSASLARIESYAVS